MFLINDLTNQKMALTTILPLFLRFELVKRLVFESMIKRSHAFTEFTKAESFAVYGGDEMIKV
jgi:hypothetical protein